MIQKNWHQSNVGKNIFTDFFKVTTKKRIQTNGALLNQLEMNFAVIVKTC